MAAFLCAGCSWAPTGLPAPSEGEILGKPLLVGLRPRRAPRAAQAPEGNLRCYFGWGIRGAILGSRDAFELFW